MRWLVVIGTAISLCGCGVQDLFFNKDVELKPGRGQMSDIKQRGVFVQSRVDATGREIPILCAEPSPDAMAAVAASLAASGSAGGTNPASGALSASVSESAAFVGLRTQTIQLLRDGFYRMCEGYMSGALTAEDFSIMQRRYQANMLALLAIEQLTGAMKSPAIAIDTATMALAQRRIEEIDTEIKANKEKTPPGDTAKLEEEKKVWLQALTGSRSQTVLTPQPDQTVVAEKVAGAVKDIVRSVVEQDNSGQLCFEYFRKGTADPRNPLTPFCVRVLDAIASNVKSKGDAVEDCFAKAAAIADPVERQRQVDMCKYLGPGTKSVAN